MPARLPKLAIAAAIVAFLVALGGLVSALGHVFLVFSAIIPAIAGITILHRRIWGAYGFALFELVTPVALLGASTIPKGRMIAVIVVSLALSLLFFFAGRSLTVAGAKRGLVMPWIVVSFLFTFPFFFFRPFVNSSGGMEDTLLLGDRMMVRTFPAVSPTHGDIIVFHYPFDRHQTFIKRVIGVSGDRIRIVSRIVYRDGSALSEPYAVHKFNVMDRYRDNLPANLSDVTVGPGIGEMLGAKDMLQNHVSNGEVVVPPGKYFVLGDNRDNSLDSRYWGFLDASDIIGKPLFIYDSDVSSGEDKGTKIASIQRVRWSRIFKLL